MLNNLFKVCWKWKKCWYYVINNVFSFFVTKKCQKSKKKSWKTMKIANIEKLVRNSSYFLNDWKNFNGIFRKHVTHDNIKSHEKPVFHPFFRRYIFWKTTGRGSNWHLLPAAPVLYWNISYTEITVIVGLLYSNNILNISKSNKSTTDEYQLMTRSIFNPLFS